MVIEHTCRNNPRLLVIGNSKLASSLVSLSLCGTFLPNQKMSLLSPGEKELAFLINSMPVTFHAELNDPYYPTWTDLKAKLFKL